MNIAIDAPKRPSKKVKCYCQNCQREFEEIPSRIKNGRGKFCSKQCQYGPIEERFWSLVDKTESVTKCWIWKGSVSGIGLAYGRFWNGKKLIQAHRYSWELHNGAIAKGDGHHGTCVLHLCDNASCVNPSHLHLGSQAENVQEMWDRKRKNVDGKNNPAAKLSQQQAEEIRSKYGYRGKQGLTLTQLSQIYNVGISTINRVIKNQAWEKGGVI